MELRPVLRPVFQPIWDLAGGKKRIGLEGLIRGISETGEVSPKTLFDQAHLFGGIVQLDTSARRSQIDFGIPLLANGERLFLNISTASMRQSLSWLPEHTDFSRITLEINEKTGVLAGPINYQLKQYRRQGLQIAIDDYGVEQTNLHLLSQLKPDWVKLDLSFVRRKDFTMIRSVRRFLEEIGSKLIVEGIEKPGDLEAVLDCGVRYMQGFALGMPETADSLTRPLLL